MGTRSRYVALTAAALGAATWQARRRRLLADAARGIGTTLGAAPPTEPPEPGDDVAHAHGHRHLPTPPPERRPPGGRPWTHRPQGLRHPEGGR